MRQYKTVTGTYSEEELAVVVWRNPKTRTSRQSRFLETMTSENSRYPMAFPIDALTRNKNWSQATLVSQDETLFDMIRDTDRNTPLIVPLRIAESALGWSDFYVPTEYDL